MTWEARVKEFWKRHPLLELPLAMVERLCKHCAEAMKAYGITALKLDGRQIPPALKQGLCDKFGPADGFFGRCVEGAPDEIDDKESFCAWLHNECLGKFPNETAAETSAAAGNIRALRFDGVLKAEWDTAYINNLPDSAFAVVLAGGAKDDEGKTVPRDLRKLPHHNASGGVDLPHLRNALARVSQTDMPVEDRAKAQRHLDAHAQAENVGAENKSDFEKYLREADLKSLEDFRAGLAEAPIIYKPEGRAQSRTESGPMIFVASEESEDRLGDTILTDGWKLDTFLANPAFMWAHDYSTAPIGTVPKVWIEGKRLLNTVNFDMKDEFAAFIAGKYQRGFLKGESVGFRVLEFEPKAGGRGMVFKQQELLEISAVPIPAHPAAIRKAMGERKFSIIKPEIMPKLWLPQEKLAQVKALVDELVAVGGQPLDDQRAEQDQLDVASLVAPLKSLGQWAKERKGGNNA